MENGSKGARDVEEYMEHMNIGFTCTTFEYATNFPMDFKRLSCMNGETMGYKNI